MAHSLDRMKLIKSTGLSAGFFYLGITDFVILVKISLAQVNHLTPNGHYVGRTAQLNSRCYILYIYSINIRTEYFKHAA